MAMFVLGRPAQADSIVRIAAEHRDELSPFARAELDMLAADLAGDRLRALEAARRRSGTALVPAGLPGTPLDPAMRAISANHPAESVEILEHAESYSERVRSYEYYGVDELLWLTLADAYHMLGDYRASLRAAREGRAHYPAMLSLLAKQVAALAALGRVDAVDDLLDESLTLPPQQGWPQRTIMRIAALELRAHGHREESLSVAQREVNWYRGLPPEERAAPEVRFDHGMAYMVAERWDEALPLFEALVAERPDDVNYQGALGVLAARRGDREEAERRSDSLVGLADPYDHGREQYWQACIAAQSGDIERALILLRESYARGRPFNVGLHIDPWLEPLHDQPLFQQLLAPKG
jgi:tetratricopeptide (TPR) repeat protein